MKRLIVIVMLLALAACATNPDRISGTYVPQSTFKGKSCDEIESMYAQNINGMNSLQRSMKKASRTNTTAGVVGAVLFWPALFFMKGKDATDDDRMAAFKGMDTALRQALLTCKT